MALRLQRSGIDEIYSSPLGRAYHTAQYTAEVLKLNMNILLFASEDIAWDYFTVPNEGNAEKDWVY